jgi:hypothetical protein
MWFVAMSGSDSGDRRSWLCSDEVNVGEVTCMWMGQLLLLYSNTKYKLLQHCHHMPLSPPSPYIYSILMIPV